MQKSTMESASWQRLLYGFEISQNQAKMPLKSGFSDGLGGNSAAAYTPAARRRAGRLSSVYVGERWHKEDGI